MRTLKEDFFDNLGISEETQIRDWLAEHNITNYRLNKDFSIIVGGDVKIWANELENGELPDYIQFDKVNGNFSIYDMRLGGYYIHSLRGCPKTVTCNFEVYAKELDSLEGGPQKVGLDFKCTFANELKSLEHCPKQVGRDFICYRTKRKFSLSQIKKYCKTIGGNIENTMD